MARVQHQSEGVICPTLQLLLSHFHVLSHSSMHLSHLSFNFNLILCYFIQLWFILFYFISFYSQTPLHHTSQWRAHTMGFEGSWVTRGITKNRLKKSSKNHQKYWKNIRSTNSCWIMLLMCVDYFESMISEKSQLRLFLSYFWSLWGEATY